MMQKTRDRSRRRGFSLLLAVLLLCGVAQLMTPQAKAAEMDYYLDKVVEWGVMRGDINGNLNPDRQITRAEFVTMVNRAYGYKDMGPNPFTDIKSSDWFYEDVCIAAKAGYFKGTTATTASPYATLTREQAAVIIGRNLMLEQGTGEALGFTDSRRLGDWSRHMIQAVAEEGIIAGYPDGSFRPKQPVTRGQVAAMLVRSIGTPVQQPGEQSLGGVYGNVTITAPGVTLKDTTVYGDLYISGGVGLSNVVLENVKVMGKIVVSGTGESEKGQHSVVLRNVTAEELVMDSLANQFVTLKSEGLTDIGQVHVRTDAYLEDVTEEAYGLQHITLEGEPEGTFQLAGNIKDVVLTSPKAEVTLAQGVAKSITVDEKATDAVLNIADKAVSKQVNLDTAAKVQGAGDVGHMNVNKAGSQSAILPDTIVVRPGITADIAGEKMDSVAAQQSSEDPRLLSGYPAARDVSPKDAVAVFKTNKKGTIYWAISSLMDGSVSEEELLHPPVYSNKLLLSGTIPATAADTEFTAKLTKLLPDGSYYISAMLVDNRGMHSPVKLTAFTTPDDSVPAFAAGYPTALIAPGEKPKEQVIQTRVMATKDCQMYYALLPKGSSAPKPADFKANSVSGNLGFGVVELQKNTPYLVDRVNRGAVREETEYDLYLWLTDADGVKSSAVKKLTVKTLDRTEPQLIHIRTSEENGTSVTLDVAVDEPVTFYWAVVKEGQEFYLNSEEGYEHTEEAKAQIKTGINSLRHGQANISKAMTDTKVVISGLQPQTGYKVYYVAVDKAGNTNLYHGTIPLPYLVHTLDEENPTVVQEFTHDGSSESKLTPYPDTSIRLAFSENVQGKQTIQGKPAYMKFEEWYQQHAESNKDGWANIIREHFQLYQGDQPAKERTDDNDADWVVDYRNVTVEWDPSGSGQLLVNFPYLVDSQGKPTKDSALNLVGGTTYQFRLNQIVDMADNVLVGGVNGNVRGIVTLPAFTTISAEMVFTSQRMEVPEGQAGLGTFDLGFIAQPEANASMPDDIYWDLVVWSDVEVEFKLYQSQDEGKTWGAVGQHTASIRPGERGKKLGVSVFSSVGVDYPSLKDQKRTHYAIEFVSIGGEKNRKNWNVPVTLHLTAIAGTEGDLKDMDEMLRSSGTYEDLMGTRDFRVEDITRGGPYPLTKQFTDSVAPELMQGYPTFQVGESVVDIKVALNRSNSSFYYVLAPVGSIVTKIQADGTDKLVVYDPNDQYGSEVFPWTKLPEDGSARAVKATQPQSSYITDNRSWNDPDVKHGHAYTDGVGVTQLRVTGLKPKTPYIAYFVLKGQSQYSFSDVYCYRFMTDDVEVPYINLTQQNPSAVLTTSADAAVDWILLSYPTVAANQSLLSAKMADKLTDTVDQNAVGQMTVIEALCQPYGTDYQSMFDHYATEQMKKELMEFISISSGPSFSTDQGKLTILKGEPQPLQFDNMAMSNQYYCIATARNSMASDTTDASKRGFKALGNIHLVDTEPPRVTCQTSLTSAGRVPGDKSITDLSKALYSTKELPTKFYYNGTITLTFDKIPYVVSDDGQKREKLTKDHLVGGKDGNRGIGTSGIDITWDDVNVTGRTVTIPFTGAHGLGSPNTNSSLTLLNEGYLSDEFGYNHHKNLVLRFDIKQNYIKGSGDAPHFVAAWEDGGN